MLQTLFYKSAKQFSIDYDVNTDLVESILLDLAKDGLQKIVIGMTELNLLKNLGMIDTNTGIPEESDPRNLIYILYID